jgi:hypothetical protein
VAPPHAGAEARDGLWLCPGDGAIDLRVAEALTGARGAGPGARILAAAALAVPTWLCRNGPGDSRAQRRLLLRARLAHSEGAQSSPWAGIEWARSEGEPGSSESSFSEDATGARSEVSAVEPPAAVAARLCAAADAVIQMLRLGGDGTGWGSGVKDASILRAHHRKTNEDR